MVNVRIDKELEKKLELYADQHHLTKSDVVKEALALYLAQVPKLDSPYEIGKDLFGAEGSGRSDGSTTFKQKVKYKIRAKSSH